ncbi:MAG: GNAT family N-acetyltransferase [Legionella sp.]|jgi:GNAT superfamily N-acetyltransferase
MTKELAYQLSLEINPAQEDIQVLGDAIMQQASEKKGFERIDFFAIFIRDSLNNIIAGCNGNTLYGCLYIDQLWVSDTYRSQGLGTKLVEAAIKYGKDKTCTFAAVNTMDWEALGFYQKCGFKIEFERHGFHKGSVFYFLRKEFH